MNWDYGCCYRTRFSSEWPSVPEPLAGWGISVVVVPPEVEPITLDEAKLWHRIDSNTEDAIITRMIRTARQWVEGYLEQSIVTQTREVYLPVYQEGIALPFGPVQSIESVNDASPYLVRYVAGFPPVVGEGTDFLINIPEPIITAMQLLIGDLYENRENTNVGNITNELPLAVEAQLAWYRRRRSFA